MVGIMEQNKIEFGHSHFEVPHYPAMDMEQLNNNNDPDILLGAYLMAHLRNTCENCGTTNTPQWRKGWYSALLGRTVLLCNACGIKYAKNQFCSHCNFIYSKEHGNHHDSDIWLTCATCYRWTHIDCEKRWVNQFAHETGTLPVVDYLDANGNLIPSAYQCHNCLNSPIVRKSGVKAML
eukprot:TRINITY_DN123_c0_g1_i1.p1 TRINITY_DN123_c0_g1~~TRINITY_DN123_c0_g1_i1.p1  ORF type:complete len:179 (+),score=45.73 TRINITY_DN123_c0_g1_i1:325-861(+)